DVEVVIRKQNLRWASGMLFMHFDEGVKAALSARLREIPIEIILPENARITFVGEYKRVCQQLVVDNRTVAYNIVILDERDRLGRTIPHQNIARSEITDTETVGIAQLLQTPAQRKIKCADRI